MCKSTQSWVLGGLMLMMVFLATSAFIADRMWQPRGGAHLPVLVAPPRI